MLLLGLPKNETMIVDNVLLEKHSLLFETMPNLNLIQILHNLASNKMALCDNQYYHGSMRLKDEVTKM